MVKVTTWGLIEKNGSVQLANHMFQLTQEDMLGWNNYEKLELKFDDESFYDEEYPFRQDVEEYFDVDTLKKWQKEQHITYPPIHVQSVSYKIANPNDREDAGCIIEIQIESDNDKAIEEIYTLMGALGNCGHSYSFDVVHDQQGTQPISINFDGVVVIESLQSMVQK